MGGDRDRPAHALDLLPYSRLSPAPRAGSQLDAVGAEIPSDPCTAPSAVPEPRSPRSSSVPALPVVPTAVPRVPPGYRFFKPGGLFGMKPPEEPFGAARTGPEESKALGSPCAGESGSVGLREHWDWAAPGKTWAGILLGHSEPV
ncbi:hypothetical protein DV515_00014950 [Chloebia gouldiae]|uniref:Uncharacterized protein n=1 Tax=Chloebia gouldiae TaxID=44316 RepID=A0A3L8RWH2_CHLGU|nr:hypothetical protein DV515_00014950 [Chloebia gouldiae]